MKLAEIYIFALAAHGQGISGSDRIFIEFARHWHKKFPVHIFLWEEGLIMCKKSKLAGSGIRYWVSKMEPWRKFGFFVNYIVRIAEGVRLGIMTNIESPRETIVYSASEFWMDSLPAFILKFRYPKIIWAAAWYQTAPNPLAGFSFGRYKLSALYYWLVQKPIKPLIAKYADFVLVNNTLEKKEFPKLVNSGKAIVVFGAVDLEKVKKWRKRSGHLPKTYDAVFQGRFHPQKGVVELIEIWQMVTAKIPRAKLAMIGDGPLMKDVSQKVDHLKLKDNIDLYGYVFDGPKKYKIFEKSKIVVHPAFYDSGGMAAAEAMAFGIPCVGFDLKSYESYYPQGMLKAKLNDKSKFAENIMLLLKNKPLRIKLGDDARKMIEKNWSWAKRSQDVLESLQSQ